MRAATCSCLARCSTRWSRAGPPFDGEVRLRGGSRDRQGGARGARRVFGHRRARPRDSSDLRKQPDDRYQTASRVRAGPARGDARAIDSASITPVRPITRLVVMPFRVLRPDPSIDFLAFSLADAVSSALSGLPSVVIRSTAAASRFANGTPDLSALAAALDVDVVLLGSMLSSGGQVRVSAQLVQVPSGTLMRAITSQSPADEIFQLQDGLAKQIVDSLSLSLTSREQDRINRTRPRTPRPTSCTCARISCSSISIEVVGGSRAVSPVGRSRSAVRAGVGEARPVLQIDWEVR